MPWWGIQGGEIGMVGGTSVFSEKHFYYSTSEKLRGHIGLGLSVRLSVRLSVCP